MVEAVLFRATRNHGTLTDLRGAEARTDIDDLISGTASALPSPLSDLAFLQGTPARGTASGQDLHGHSGVADAGRNTPPGNPDPHPRATDHGTGAEAQPDILPAPLPDHGLRRGQAPDSTGPGGTPQGIVIDSTVVLGAVPANTINVAYGDSFKLHSLPGSTYKIYLDFDGHTSTGTSWNSYWGTSSFYSPAFSTDGSESFGSGELATIQRVWQRVAEYFSPFNIDVTTEDPGLSGLTYSGAGDATHGIRVVVTQETGKNYGGIAYNGSFSYGVDTPAFVYAANLGNDAKYIADAVAHEVGHTLNLNHDGQGTSEYYYGHGSGATSWAPVLGAGYYSTVVQWSNGGYSGATNTQDDLAIITSQNNGVAYRADDAGNTYASAAALGGSASGGVASVFSYGIISGSGANNDVDMYWLNVAAGGSINLTVTPQTLARVTGSSTPVYSASPFSMLDVKLALYDASYKLVAGFDDPTRQDGAISVSNLAGGTYYLAIDGTGWGTPTASPPTGWSEYGSLGQYAIQGSYSLGSYSPPPPPPALQLGKSSLTTNESGASDSVVVKAVNATGDVLVTVGGLDATEGALSATTLLLNAANNWTATLGVTGVNDRDADGTQSYQLGFSASGLGTVYATVGNLDNDIGPASVGSTPTTTVRKTATTGKVAATSVTGTAPALSADDGVVLKIAEGGSSTSYTAEWRWQFNLPTAGNATLHVDATSTGEAFRFEYSTDSGASWKGFQGAPANAAAWNGDYLLSGAGTSVLVRLIDAVRSGDSVRDSFSVDLLTVTPAVVAAAPAAADPLQTDFHLF